MSRERNFDDFLKRGAGRFEIKPRKGSFQKIRQQSRRNSLTRLFIPFLALAVVLGGIYIQQDAVSPQKSLVYQPKTGYAVSQFELPTLETSHIFPILKPQVQESVALSLPYLVKLPESIEITPPSIQPESSVEVPSIKPAALHLDAATLSTPRPVPVRPTPEKKRRIQWQVYAGTGYAFRHLEYRNRNSYNPHSFTNVDGFDWKQHRGIQGFVAGLTAEMQLTGKVYIKTGLQFFAGGYDIQNKFTNYQPLGMSAMPYEERVRSEYRIMFGEIPMAVGYKLYFPKYTIRWEGGVNISTKLYQSIPEAAGLLGREYSVWNGTPRLVGVTAQLSPGIEFKYGRHQIVTGLDLRYQLTSTYISSYPVKEHLYFAGIRTGLKF